MATAKPELADFDPGTGHLHACEWEGVSDQCGHDCAAFLYAIAQDAEAAVVQVRGVCDEWDGISKGETATTARIRAALEVAW